MSAVDDLNAATWQWTKDTMASLDALRLRAVEASRQSTTLEAKLAARHVEGQAIKGRLAIAAIFGRVVR